MAQATGRGRTGSIAGEGSMTNPVTTIFDTSSIDPVSSLYVIRGNNPVIVAYDIPEDMIIWLEIVELTEAQSVSWAGCCVKNIPPQSVISVNRLRCSQCDADIDGEQVIQYARLTSKNPVIEINLPYGTYYQLRLDGPGIGTFYVRQFYSDRQFEAGAPTVTNGCPCIQYIDHPELWIPTGQIRCFDDTNTLEWEFRSPDGQFTMWKVVGSLTWRDTGAIRELCTPSDTTFEQQQINDCGYARWVEVDCMAWSDTGLRRTVQTTGAVEKQQVNIFGRFRWIVESVYIATACFIPWPNYGSSTNITASYGGSTNTVTMTSTARTVEVGYGFLDGPNRDPAATVSTTHPISGTCYIYPTPRANATVEVWNTLATGAKTLVGYARNNPLGWFPQSSSQGDSTGIF